jgi:hypothetical protein
MTSYTVCARVGCSNRVSYDPKKDTERSKYCKCCADEMFDRLANTKQLKDDEIESFLITKVIR